MHYSSPGDDFCHNYRINMLNLKPLICYCSVNLDESAWHLQNGPIERSW